MGTTFATSITLRPARADDLDFAWSIYAEGIQPFASAYYRWDEADQAARFARIYDWRHSVIVQCDGRDAGWFTITRTERAIWLQQFFIAVEFRDMGIGSYLLERLCEEWDETKQIASLMVLRNNPARHLYARFGFRAIRRNDSCDFMLRRPQG